MENKLNKIKKVAVIVTISLGTLLIISISMAANGFKDYTKPVFDHSDENKLILKDSYPHYNSINPPKSQSRSMGYAITLGESYINETELEKYKKDTSKFNIKKYQSTHFISDSTALDGLGKKAGEEFQNGMSSSLAVTEGELVKNFIHKDYSFDKKYENKIPVIAPLQYFEMIENKKLYEENSEIKYKFRQEMLDKYIGKSFSLINTGLIEENPESFKFNNGYQKLDIEVIIIGITFGNINMYESITAAFTLPNWSVAESSKLKSLLQNSAITEIHVEFDHQNDLNRFQKEALLDEIDSGISESAYKSYLKPINQTKDVLVSIGGFLFFLSLLLSISLANDNSIFKAIFTSLGIGTLSALVLNLILSIIFKNEVYYSALIHTTGEMAEKLQRPGLVFLNLPLLEVLLLLGIGLVLIISVKYVRNIKN